jgi:hypothetical protein
MQGICYDHCKQVRISWLLTYTTIVSRNCLRLRNFSSSNTGFRQRTDGWPRLTHTSSMKNINLILSWRIFCISEFPSNRVNQYDTQLDVSFHEVQFFGSAIFSFECFMQGARRDSVTLKFLISLRGASRSQDEGKRRGYACLTDTIWESLRTLQVHYDRSPQRVQQDLQEAVDCSHDRVLLGA